MQATIADIKPIYAIVGADRFLRQEALERILSTVADEMESLGPARFDGAQAELAEVLDEVRTMSLLSSRRIVIVDDADLFITANREALERYARDPAVGGTLIFACQSFPKTTRLSKAIQKSGEVVSCPALKGRAVGDWITQRARTNFKKRLIPGTAGTLREHVGDSLGALDAELGKLAAFVGERSEITPADVDALTGNHREETVFGVIDAIASHDVVSAMRHWEQVLATDRAAPGRAIAGLAWGVRRLLKARRDWDNGVSVGMLARSMFTDPHQLQQRLKCVSVKQLEEQLRDLRDADLAVKTGGSTVGLAVEKFIVKHGAKSA